MLTSKLGDVKLAALMMMSHVMKEGLLAEVLRIVGEGSESLPLDQLLQKFVEESTNGEHGTNWGTLRPPITDEQFENDDLTPPPPRNLKQAT